MEVLNVTVIRTLEKVVMKEVKMKRIETMEGGGYFGKKKMERENGGSSIKVFPLSF